MKKHVCLGGVLLTISVLLTGCSNAIPEMDEETQALVVEYAAGIVQKYDKNHVSKLMELKEPENQEEERAEEKAALKEAPENTASQPDTDTEITDQTQEEETPAVDTLDGLLQMDNISFSYTGYETTPFYPTDDSEIAFVMNATEGTELLILKFTAQNLTGSEITLNMNDMDVSYKISVNGSTTNALFTMLLNDLSKYQGLLAAGESKELVLVCEIAKEEISSITSISVQARKEDISAVISLEEGNS